MHVVLPHVRKSYACFCQEGYSRIDCMLGSTGSVRDLALTCIDDICQRYRKEGVTQCWASGMGRVHWVQGYGFGKQDPRPAAASQSQIPGERRQCRLGHCCAAISRHALGSHVNVPSLMAFPHWHRRRWRNVQC